MDISVVSSCYLPPPSEAGHSKGGDLVLPVYAYVESHAITLGFGGSYLATMVWIGVELPFSFPLPP
jgi:hypothetical protein